MSLNLTPSGLTCGMHILFAEVEPKPKARVWEVWTKEEGKPGFEGGDILGYVKWFGRWRCYAFFPLQGCVFEKTCLRDIAEFCERSTTQQRQLAALSPNSLPNSLPKAEPQGENQ